MLRPREHPPARLQCGDLLDLAQRVLGLTAQLMHQRPAYIRRHHHFGASGVPMAIRVLARPVDVELVMRVFDERDRHALQDKPWYELLDQRRLATTRPSRKSENLHLPPVIDKTRPCGQGRMPGYNYCRNL